jgi:pimeloyl-ACP methyl ester carboxylesterase
MDRLGSALTPGEESPWQAGLRRTTVAGCEIQYLRYGAGPPVVLLHTLRTQLDYFHPMLHELGQGFEILALDLPGHGNSGAPRVEYTAAYFTDITDSFLEAQDLQDVVLVGESIGASIALGLAARRNPRVARVVALNPYDYGRWGGIRRSSPLANLLFTAMLWPGIGSIVARTGTKGVLRRILEGGLCDRRKLQPGLVNELHRCGSLPGHPRAFRSLCLHWQSWIAARTAYAAIHTPVTLVYGAHDWSRQKEREANARAIPGARNLSLPGCRHFSCLEEPRQVAQIIRDAL